MPFSPPRLPEDRWHEMRFDCASMSFQENKAQEGVPPSVVFGMSLLFVFLIETRYPAEGFSR